MAERRADDSKEECTKLMEKFQGILNGTLWFMFPTMVGISHRERLSEDFQAKMAVAFVAMATFSVVTWILSYTTKAHKWLGLVSRMTEAVSILCLRLRQFAVGLPIPTGYSGHYWVTVVLCLIGVGIIHRLWKPHFRCQKPRMCQREIDSSVETTSLSVVVPFLMATVLLYLWKTHFGVPQTEDDLNVD